MVSTQAGARRGSLAFDAPPSPDDSLEDADSLEGEDAARAAFFEASGRELLDLAAVGREQEQLVEDLEAAFGAARASLADLDALAAKAWDDVGKKLKRKPSGDGAPAAAAPAEVSAEVAEYLAKLDGDVARLKKDKADGDDVLEQAKIADRLRGELAALVEDHAATRGAVADARDAADDLGERVRASEAAVAGLDDRERRLKGETRDLVELLLKAELSALERSDADEDRVSRDDVDDLSLQLARLAGQLNGLAESKIDKQAHAADLEAKADRAALDAYAPRGLAAELDETLARCRGDLGDLRRKTDRDLKVLKRHLEALVAEALAERDGVDGSAATTQCLTCRRDVPETNGEGAAVAGHRKLLPRLGTPPGSAGGRPGSPDDADRGDVYRGGFKMPLPGGPHDRPGTAPDARTAAEAAALGSTMMRSAPAKPGRPHTPQIMAIVEPLARPGTAGAPGAMDGYAPPPGNHGGDFRNAGGRMEGRALKSEKVVVPSTNRGRVNSLLSQAASLDTQALASIGLASSASEKYVRAKPPLPAL